MDSHRRGRGHKPSQSLTPGTFRPARPADTQGVVHLFAIAARAACAQPKNLSAITQTLSHTCSALVSPELDAAQECARMWQLFAKVAELPKDTLRLEAGRAFCRDLDTLAQKLELPPLAEWVDLPEAISEAGYDEATQGHQQDHAAETASLDFAVIVDRARELVLQYPDKKSVPAHETATLLAHMDADKRSHWLDHRVGQGILGRTDVNLLIRFLAKGGAVQSGDTMLIEVLDKLVHALSRPTPF